MMTGRYILITLPETNGLPLKMDGWSTRFLLGWPIFRCELLVFGSVITKIPQHVGIILEMNCLLMDDFPL